MILVVVSKAGIEGEEVPSSLKKGIDSDDTEVIEEMITDKPKKPKANSNTNKKKVDTTCDVSANAANSDKSTDAEPDANDDKTGGVDKNNKNALPATGPKPSKTPAADKPAAAKLAPVKPAAGETRPKIVGKP